MVLMKNAILFMAIILSAYRCNHQSQELYPHTAQIVLILWYTIAEPHFIWRDVYPQQLMTRYI